MKKRWIITSSDLQSFIDNKRRASKEVDLGERVFAYRVSISKALDLCSGIVEILDPDVIQVLMESVQNGEERCFVQFEDGESAIIQYLPDFMSEDE